MQKSYCGAIINGSLHRNYEVLNSYLYYNKIPRNNNTFLSFNSFYYLPVIRCTILNRTINICGKYAIKKALILK